MSDWCFRQELLILRTVTVLFITNDQLLTSDINDDFQGTLSEIR